MGCCEVNHTFNRLEFKCPSSNQIGTNVETITIENIVKKHFRTKINRNAKYKYCKSQNCSVFYFSENILDYFNTIDLDEKVTLKDKGLDVKVCYCFGYTRQNILDDFHTFGKNAVLSNITSKMKNPGCFCDKNNPQGSCCLMDVTTWLEEIETNTRVHLK